MKIHRLLSSLQNGLAKRSSWQFELEAICLCCLICSVLCNGLSIWFFSFHHCIVWPSSIFDFRLPLWYLPTGSYWELQWKNTICRSHNLFKFIRQSQTGNLLICISLILKTVRTIQHMLVYYINRINSEHRNIKEKNNHQNCSRNYCILHV